MSNIFQAARVAAMALLCLMVAACTQTATSTHSGAVGGGKLTSSEAQKKKILAARERARAAKKARQEARAAKLSEARAKRTKAAKANKRQTSKKVARTAKKKTAKKVAKKTRSKKTTKKVAKRKTAKSNVKKRVAKITRSKKKSKGKTYALAASVGGRAGKLNVRSPWKCVPKRLKNVIAQIRKRYGSVTINSTHRSSSRNRLVGGKKRSYHLRCQAVDFRVHGKTKGLLRWLARHPQVGGYKRYRSGFYHIDTGPKRTW